MVEVPPHKMGAIIGRGGSEIVNMERVSGAKIQTPRRDEGDPKAETRPVSVTGTAAQIAKAKELIAAVLAAPSPRGDGGPPVNLAGLKFADKDALWAHCHKLIERIEEDTALA